MERRLFSELRSFYESTREKPKDIRIRIRMRDLIDPDVLRHAVDTAMQRYPYFCVGLQKKDGQWFFLDNHRPVVITNSLRGVELNSEASNCHMIAFSRQDNWMVMDVCHAMTDGTGAYEILRTLLFYYCSERYKITLKEEGIRLVGDPVLDEEWIAPVEMAADLPVPSRTEMPKALNLVEAAGLQEDTRSTVYSIAIPESEFMRFNIDNDGSPNSILSALLFKTAARVFPEAGQLSGKIICNYRKDVGCPETHCDLVRFLRAVYQPKMKDWSVDRISTVTRGSMFLQMEPEFSWREYRKLYAMRQGIDDQPNLDQKKKYAAEHSLLTHAPSDTYTISYVGQTDWGGIGAHIEGAYTISDGHLLLEVNATDHRFCISFQTIRKDDRYLREFLQVLNEEGIHYRVGEREDRKLPTTATA